MVSHLFFYQLTLIALVWLCVMLHGVWPSDSAAACPTPLAPTPPRPKRRRAPKPFEGVIKKPPCDSCASVGAAVTVRIKRNDGSAFTALSPPRPSAGFA